MWKKVILILVGILLAASIYLLVANLNLKESLQNLSGKKEVEFKKQLHKEKEKLKRNLEEKHRADKVSYKTMIKRLELEKSKARQMQKEMEELKKKK